MKMANKLWGVGLLAFTLTATAPLKLSAQSRVGDSSLVFKKPADNSQQAKTEALKQKAEQIKGEQQTLRQQRRQERIREWQERTVSAPIQPPPIWGQTPLQQQQMAVRARQRQLQWQQQQAQRAQQLQFQRQQQNRKPGQ